MLLFILVLAGIVAAFFVALRFLLEGVCGVPPEQRVFGDFMAIDSAIRAYRLNAGGYPTTEQGMEALVTRPTTEPLPARWAKIADTVPKDAWNHPYHYRLLPQDGEPAFEIISAGKDGVLGTTDDLSSLDKGR